MNQGNNNRCRVRILLEVILLTFVFAYSSVGAYAYESKSSEKLTISASPTDQFVFRDSDSSSELLLSSASKTLFSLGEIHNLVVDLPVRELSTNGALLVSNSLYNTFYTNTFIGAP